MGVLSESDMYIHFRVIGDVHGQPNIAAYLKRARKAEYSLQLGDLSGRNYRFLNELDPHYHRVLAGNHEVYNTGSEWYFRNVPHFLGNFGVWSIPNFPDIFYVRGGLSLNKKWKEARGTWSIEEECTVPELTEAIELYDYMRPDFMVTHEAPLRMVQYVSDPMVAHNFGFSSSIIRTKTNQALDAMMEIHQPKIWIFGHYHRYLSKHLGGTHFICLNDMPYNGHFIDFPKMESEEDAELKAHHDPNDPFELELGGMG
tara:strand:- start:1182 stop:1952 length:771 start_codon:yes stop_codon:yes gene_type:complete